MNKRRKFMIWAYKALVIFTVLFIGFKLYQMTSSGQDNIASGHDTAVVAEHRRQAHVIAWATLILVLLIEVGVRLNGGSERDLLFWIHAIFALLYTASIVVLVFWYDGSRPHHMELAYFAMSCFTVVAVLGTYMLLTRL